MILDSTDTICALSTANGMGAIAMIRVSGERAFEIVSSVFSKKIEIQKSHSAHFGVIKNVTEIIDEVVVTVFKNPASFTGEDVVEIACHGSVFIQQEILKLLLSKGCRLAKAGEFSMRAFANGKFDLSQAEAISDLISSTTEASHKLAMQQMRGGFSDEINGLREELVNFASLIELELDFSEEDVEFADRTQLNELLVRISAKLNSLIDSFSFGNAIKNGVPISIIGAPNSGKSTLLNRFLKEEKAIVSNIAGTTRDIVEDEIIIEGIKYRFIDTAGIRDTENEIEKIGIQRAIEKAGKSAIILYLFDSNEDLEKVKREFELLKSQLTDETIDVIWVANKIDLLEDATKLNEIDCIKISAFEGENLEVLTQKIIEITNSKQSQEQQVVVTNVRHFEALTKANNAIIEVTNALEMGIPGDLVAIDIRQSLHFLGEITGEISTDELLGNIFSKFCIGK
ncbi:MAG: tRNA uridine-5-carboxymethylaminomethyl(34) synthesis GTPase MnmE [Flavobacteriales bacterium]|jgi:tRNA modification GTPase